MFFNKPQSVSKKDKIKARILKSNKEKILFKTFEIMRNMTIELRVPAVKSNKERCDERNKIKYASTR